MICVQPMRPALMRPALKEAVLFPVPHRKQMDSMCSKCPINNFNIQAKQASCMGLETWPKFKFYKLVI